MPRTTLLLRLCAAILTVGLVAPVPSAFAAAPDFGALRRPTPYVRLWSEANSCSQNGQVNGLTGSALTSRLTEIDRWFRHLNSQGSNRFLLGRDCRGRGTGTLAAKLTARGVLVSNYRNGSYVSQSSRSASLNFGEAGNLERTAPLAIGTFWPGDWQPYGSKGADGAAARLTRGLDRGATTVRVSSPAGVKPGSAPSTWPYLASRGSGTQSGAYSRNTHDVVSWIRVGQELMKIVGAPTVDGGDIVLRVQRGLWSTDAARHDAGERVLSPVYIGSAALDRALSGTPSRNDVNYPLRYALKIWRHDAHAWLARRIKTTFGSDWQGYNAVWLDTTSCVQYSNADPYGNQVWGWNDPAKAKLTAEAWGDGQRAKLRALRKAFPGRRMIANSLINTNPCTRRLLRGSVDAGSFEHWMEWGTSQAVSWFTSMDQLHDVMANDLPAMFWVRWDKSHPGTPAQYRRFAYGSMLLAHRPSTRHPMFGGPWGLTKPDELFFWNWGSPRETVADVAKLQVPGLGLYRRDFDNGIVVVNPGNESITYRLGATFYDVLRPNASGQPTAVTSMTIPAHDVAFLLRSR